MPFNHTMILYHRTNAAKAILRNGFRDCKGSYMFEGNFTLRGVFFSDRPLDCNDGANGDQLLQVTLPDSLDISAHELIEEDKTYREWCIPAQLINRYGLIRLCDQ